MKILSVVGARPQFVKAAMIAVALGTYGRTSSYKKSTRHVLLHTGQHYDPKLSDVFFEQLPLPKPRYNLGVGSGTHGKQTGDLLKGIEAVLLKEKPDTIVLYGDTNSTVAGALAAAKLQIRIAHVEAGLRSFNRAMPEEINRVVADHLSDILFCPTQTSVVNLKNEGITNRVYLSGDVMLDAVLSFATIANRRSRILARLGLVPSEYILCTIHRAENTNKDEQIADVVRFLTRTRRPVVFPMHPRTYHRLASRSLRHSLKLLKSAENVQVVEPVSYLDMLALTGNARVVLTDSGGLQKEAYFLKVPCLTLRNETEWTETLEGGWNRLLQLNSDEALALLETVSRRNGMCPTGTPDLERFGGGRAANLIVHQLVNGN